MSRIPAVVVAVLVLLLSGCAVVPVSGGVNVGVVQDTDVQGGCSFAPRGPTGNASPAQIVQGFIEAATGQQNRYEIARSFLTPSFASRWDPGARVLVHATSTRVRATGRDAYTVTVPTVAQVDARGSYTPTADPSSSGSVKPKPIPLPITLTKTGKGWRIASAPAGIVLPQAYFACLFSPATLTFFDPTFTRTVPDLRWYANSADVPDAVLSGLAAGPAGPIAAPVAVSAFPSRSRVASVRLTAGVAIVDLTTTAPVAAAAVQRIRTQIQSSLPTVSDVQLSVDGVQQAVSGTPPRQSDLLPDPHPLVRRGSSIGYLEGSAVRRDAVLGRQVLAVRPLAATISDRLRIAAVRTADGVRVVTGSAHPLVDDREGLIDPSLDPFGWTWSVPRTDPGALEAFDVHGKVRHLHGPFDAAQSMDAIEVSRDGTRLLVLLQTQAGPVARVVGIERDAKGAPIGLSARGYVVPAPGVEGIDATWVDPVTVATLTGGGDDGEQVTKIQVGGVQAVQLDRPGDAVAIVGGAEQSELTALLRGGGLARHDQAWRTVGTGVSLLAVQR